MHLPDDQGKLPVTKLLQLWRAGDDGAMDLIAPLIYSELHRRAGAHLSGERRHHTLSTTDLVHEAYLRLVGERERDFQSRLHFFALASKVMRDVLIQYARARKASKRGGDALLLRPENLEELGDDGPVDLVPALAEAVTALAERDSRKAWIVEMFYFAGLQIAEIAEVLELGSATVKRDLAFARAWLRKRLRERKR